MRVAFRHVVIAAAVFAAVFAFFVSGGDRVADPVPDAPAPMIRPF